MAEPQIAHDAAAAAADRQSDTASAPTPLPTLEGCRKGFLPEERVCLGTLGAVAVGGREGECQSREGIGCTAVPA